jgi:hypothetical protein
MKTQTLPRAQSRRNIETTDSWRPIGNVIASSTITALAALRPLLDPDRRSPSEYPVRP